MPKAIINPFRPGLPVDPRNFVGREKEIGTFKHGLELTENINPQNMAIIGERGIGKTSILRKFKDIANQKECLLAKVDLDASITSIDIISNMILNELKNTIQVNKSYNKIKDKVKEFFDSYNPTLNVVGTGFGISKKENKEPPQIYFKKNIILLWEKVKDTFSSLVIMIDEAEMLEHVTGALHFLRNVFQELGEKYPIMLIISGKLSFYQEISKIHSPLIRFFKPLEISALDYNSSLKLITQPLNHLGLKIGEKDISYLVQVSMGHPHILQVIGFEIIESEVYKGLVADHDQKKLFSLWDIVLSRTTSHLFQNVFSEKILKLSERDREILKLFIDKIDKEKLLSTEIVKDFVKLESTNHNKEW